MKKNIAEVIREAFGGSFSVAILKRWVVIAIGVGLSAHLVDGITYDDGWALFWAIVLLSIFNLVLKPILILFTLPFIILSLGVGIWFINALLFVLVGKLIEGFHVESYKAALWGALIVSVVSLLGGIVDGMTKKKVHPSDSGGGSEGEGPRPRVKKAKDEDDVIDI